MVAENILKNFNLTVDGRGFAGNIDEFTPPELSMKEEDFRAGGMDAPVGVQFGMEKLTASFVTKKHCHETLALFGVNPWTGTIPLTARGVLESNDGSISAVKITMRGQIQKVTPAAWKPGEASTYSYSIGLSYYKYEVDNRIIHEFDVPNMVRIVNGIDRLMEHRAALGL